MRLSVFAGDFDLPATEAVGSGDDIPRDSVLDVLTGLVDKSVVVPLEGDEVRYRLLATIREYGLQRLAGSGAASGCAAGTATTTPTSSAAPSSGCSRRTCSSR